MKHPVTHSRDTVLTRPQLAEALQVSESTLDKMALPVAYLSAQTPRYLWGQVLDAVFAGGGVRSAA